MMSMNSQEDAIACYELQMPEICGTQPLAACFCRGTAHSANKCFQIIVLIKVYTKEDKPNLLT